MSHQLRGEKIIGCRSDDLRLELAADIGVIGWSGGATLKASADDAEKRRALISDIRGGKHVELEMVARTFRQKAGVMNKRFLRIADDDLARFAKTFAGNPALVDHNTHEQSARIGTILSSEAEHHGGTGWSSLLQTVRVVKPEAAISVLDGTIDRFSIGWHHGAGDVLCTVHRTSVLSSRSCHCWPGDRVQVDGAEKIVEYEFQSAEGVEVSAVNSPAVKGTKIEDIRAALAYELNFEPHQERSIMKFPRLAAVLGLAAFTESDDERAALAIETARRGQGAAEQERDEARRQLSAAQGELAAVRTSTSKAAIDAVLDGAYRDGKLRYGRDSEGKPLPSAFEPMLRKLAESDPAKGIDLLRQEITGMPQVVPVGHRALESAGASSAPTGGGAAPTILPVTTDPNQVTPEMRRVAADLGITVEAMLNTAATMNLGGR